MFASVTSAALVGVEPRPVRVEAHVSGGESEQPRFNIVGLPDASIREARQRVQAAILSTGHRFPHRRVTVNLAPADLPKVGSAFDLPIALGVLAAAGLVPQSVTRVVALGELALDGSVRPARGGLAAGIVAGRRGLPCIVAGDAGGEAALSGADVRGVTSLAHAVAVGMGDDLGIPGTAATDPQPSDFLDLAAVRGQATARRTLEIAAAGGHHLLLVGPPGAGKTMLARSLPGILPDLTAAESLEVAQSHSAAGRGAILGSRPPFRSPHHSATPAAILGGGSGVPVPGELTLADRGVLFLDELAEFPAHLLDTLRQPVEEGRVHIARKGISVTFPCRVQLVAATNPCPCGHLGDGRTPCRCAPRSVARYRGRLSGPLLDRFDLRIVVPRVEASALVGARGEPSIAVRRRVTVAREAQDARGMLNRSLGSDALEALPWSADAVRRLVTAMDRLSLTARGWDRVRRTARTVADLAGVDTVTGAHVDEALGLRREL